jgi:hypothetical protein
MAQLAEPKETAETQIAVAELEAKTFIKDLAKASKAKKPVVAKGIVVDNPLVLISVKSIPNLEFADDAGMHYFLEEIRNGEYVLRPRHVHPG